MERWAEVDRYIAERLVRDDPVIDTGGLPPHEVTAPQGALLELLARAIGARRILEIGTLGGYSTSWLARAGARVVTLEVDPAYAEIAGRNLAGLDVELIVGPALETLPTVEGPFDLIFIDADKRSNREYLRHALRLSRPGTLIVADNVIRGGAVVEDFDDPSVQGVRAFFDALAAEQDVLATAIQTVGGKGYDGFALALVGGDVQGP
jgi:predicted O-methyltransferase YrrM